MKIYTVLDSSFLVATIDNNDALHTDAVFIFHELINRKDYAQIIIPPLVIYEVMVTLRRKGAESKTIETVLMRLVNLPYATILALSELSALKHASSALNNTDVNKALRTQDFLIFCVANEFEAVFFTFDKQMWTRCKPIYPDVYYCSGKGDMKDEWMESLQAIDSKAGKDISKIDYLPF